MSARITQCPHCRTAFRVTPVQLQAAAGTVRCGTCLHTFHATIHWSDPAQSDRPSSSSPPDSSEHTSAFDGDPPSALSQNRPEGSGTGSLLELDGWEEEPRSIFEDFSALNAELESDEQWAHELLRELEEEGQDNLEPVPTLDRITVLSQHEAATLSPTAPLFTFAEVPSSDDDELALAAPEHRKPHNLLAVEPEPLHLTAVKLPARRLRTFIHAVLLVFALVMLAGQYIYFNFDRLAMGPRREQLGLLCDTLGCQLPQRSLPGLVRISNLLVRSHPEQPDALLVDAMIVNRATFAQPFPRLRLVFTDLSDTPVASRSFAAEEYLAGELHDHGEMPSQQPIHIALELVDPGPRAMNYELIVEPAASGA